MYVRDICFRLFPMSQQASTVQNSVKKAQISQLKTTVLVIPPPHIYRIYLFTYVFTDEVKEIFILRYFPFDWGLTDWALANLGKILGLEIEGKAAKLFMMTFCFPFYFLFILFEELKESQESCLSPLYVRILFKEKYWHITTIEHVKDIKLDKRYMSEFPTSFFVRVPSAPANLLC
jgi:hypothetical protein